MTGLKPQARRSRTAPLWTCPKCGRRFANHVHHFKLDSARFLDTEFLALLRQAYAVGSQEHL